MQKYIQEEEEKRKNAKEEEQKEIDGKVIKLQIWDTAGHERFRSITYSYYRGANAIIIVFDLSDKKSFISITEWLKQIEKHGVISKMNMIFI